MLLFESHFRYLNKNKLLSRVKVLFTFFHDLIFRKIIRLVTLRGQIFAGIEFRGWPKSFFRGDLISRLGNLFNFCGDLISWTVNLVNFRGDLISRTGHFVNFCSNYLTRYSIYA